MNANGSKIWFPAKKYGWGWGPPCSWQGWVVLVVWVSLLAIGGPVLALRNIPLFVAYSLTMSAALFGILLIKGEKPRWRWGVDEKISSPVLAQRLAELDDLRQRKLVSAQEYESKRRELLKDL